MLYLRGTNHLLFSGTYTISCKTFYIHPLKKKDKIMDKDYDCM